MAPSEYPNWLPPAVAAEAWELSQGFGADPEIAAAIERLVTCEKMRSVWRELLKRRKAGGYLHPARRTPEHPADLDDNALQAQALRHVFGNAAVMVRAALPAVTAAEFKRNLAKSVETERRFRWVAEVVEGHNNNPELVAALIQESDFFARGRESYRQLGFPVVERHRSDAKTVGYLVALGSAFEDAFGKPLIRTIQRIATAALGHPIGDKLVKDAVAQTAKLRA